MAPKAKIAIVSTAITQKISARSRRRQPAMIRAPFHSLLFGEARMVRSITGIQQ
jgi:hypothetical protein